MESLFGLVITTKFQNNPLLKVLHLLCSSVCYFCFIGMHSNTNLCAATAMCRLVPYSRSSQ